MEEPESKILVAVKERMSEETKIKEMWGREIETLKEIEQKIKGIASPRIICTMDQQNTKKSNKYIVMEWAEGKNLSKKIEIVEEKEILRMFLLISNELNKIHLCGFVHRDIKLENIINYKKNDSNFYCFIDFGSSHFLASDLPKIATYSPQFSPPEQNTEKESESSDVYSLGVCFRLILSSCSKFFAPSQCLIDLVDNLVKDDPSERLSLKFFIDSLIDIVTSKKYPTNFDIYDSLSSNKKFEQPLHCERYKEIIEKLNN